MDSNEMSKSVRKDVQSVNCIVANIQPPPQRAHAKAPSVPRRFQLRVAQWCPCARATCLSGLLLQSLANAIATQQLHKDHVFKTQHIGNDLTNTLVGLQVGSRLESAIFLINQRWHTIRTKTLKYHEVSMSIHNVFILLCILSVQLPWYARS